MENSVNKSISSFFHDIKHAISHLPPNTMNMVFLLLTLVSGTYAFSTATTQKHLESLIQIQGAKISELSKINKELHDLNLSSDVSNTNNIKSLNAVVNELISKRAEESKRALQANGLLSDNVLGTTTATYSANFKGLISIKSTEKVSIYSNPSSSSTELLKASPDSVFFFFSNQKDWYQIEIEKGKMGWVEKKFVQELPKL